MSPKNKIARLILGSGESSADMMYATGIPTPDDFIFFQFGNERGAILSPLEFDRASSAAKGRVSIHTESEFDGPDRMKIFSAVARRFNLSGFEVPGDFPLLWADRIRDAGLTVTPVSGAFHPSREYKTPDEVRAIAAAQRAAESGLARAIEILRECDIGSDSGLVWNGTELTSEILRGEIDCEMMRMDMSTPAGTICAGGAQGAQPHNCGSGKLYAGQPIVMDIFARSRRTGYWGDLTRTVVKGKAPEIVRRAFDAVLEARELGKSLISAGAVPASIHLACAGHLEKRGFHSGCSENGNFGFFHGLGHGVGLEIHESPRLAPRGLNPLRGGEVVTVEPGLYYPEWGGIRLEDLMYLHHDGHAECLTAAETFLTV